MAPARVPTQEDFDSYDGAHCNVRWTSLPDGWRCPSCDRTPFELLRWTRRFSNQLANPGAKPYMDWMAGLHGHHDHGGDRGARPSRFPETLMCDQCNAADGRAKRALGLPVDWSFSPQEIGRFVRATPHDRHRLDLDHAARVFAAAWPAARGSAAAASAPAAVR